MKKVLKELNKSASLIRANGLFFKKPSLQAFRLIEHQRTWYYGNYYSFSEKKDEPLEKTETQNLEFKAETKKLLDIVAKSLYTDKDVFIRELLSNASDALEKQRFNQLTGKDNGTGEELGISITCNENKRQIIIQDTGIGMTKEELVENLGTIARSGSKEFVNALKEGGQGVVDNIIGQFGVGFYSGFIVGDFLEVISKSSASSEAYLWSSDGSGRFEISKVNNPGFTRGTKIIIHLKQENASFSKTDQMKKIIEKYSNFLNYPISLNGEKVNFFAAIWSRDKRELTDQDYKNFWEHFTGTKTDYKYKTHFVSDVPLSVKSILYIPSSHSEIMTAKQEELQINLYSRKVLVKAKARELLPDYLRFVKGVVDCEDIPLNISRESYQDSSIITKLRTLLTKRVLRLLDEEARKNPESYLKWYNDFQIFLKEGLASDPENIDDIMRLTRYEGNWTKDLITMEDYIKNMKPGQNKIYYITAFTRAMAENSPYLEAFEGTGFPVLYLTMHFDELVFRGMDRYKNHQFINVETSYEEIAKELKTFEHDQANGLPEEDVTAFCLWAKNELQPLVSKVQVSKSLKNSALLTRSHMSATMRQIMHAMEKDMKARELRDLSLEINPNHQIVKKLNELRKINPGAASLFLKQLLDNFFMDTGVLTDTQSFVNRVNNIMVFAASNGTSTPAQNQSAHREIDEEIENLSAEINKKSTLN